MFGFFKSKKVNIYAELNEIAENIYKDFGFNRENVSYELSSQKNIGEAYGWREGYKQFKIVIGIKNYIDANAIDDIHRVYFKNTLFHEFVHANTFLNTPEKLYKSFH
ncbi:hypothetical protein BK133_17320 [Paenibacillus sp. FSL H8-0548]|uniref:hypothetical protein n=1 Tax=Paenibacillus sp. FSL H8-0548 TaxID=1920422 RepID=UPI00096CE4B2|nr:hypothetical protein [Paenibacillus sp. FSL H8-0548]OMF29762.1 hypothetical protein BK133_17320 [Paenibacillus sp. FSL H8-0548]